jgi:hypothetical protein
MAEGGGVSSEGGGGKSGGEERREVESERCEPVFVINNQLPAFEQKPFSTAEICAAGERVCGYNSMEGAQRIGSLWRIYPRTRDNRQKLLIHGLVLRGVQVSVKSRNPFLVRAPNSNDKVGDRTAEQPPSTKLVISNIPLSYSDNEILQAVNNLGVTAFSKLICERDRDEKGKLTHWKTGRRFMYIALPQTPLQRNLDIGPFKASLFHKEQKTADRQRAATCRNCLQPGHLSADCTAPVKCKQCYKDGHKAGDPVCSLTPDSQTTLRNEDNTKDIQTQDTQDKHNNQAQSQTQNENKGKDKPAKTGRGRSRVRALSCGQRTLTSYSRMASSSAKRKKQQLDDTPPSQAEKQRRLRHNSHSEEEENEWG